MYVLWLESGYTVKYRLSPCEIPRAPPSGFPSGSGYISQYIPPLVTVELQCPPYLGIGAKQWAYCEAPPHLCRPVVCPHVLRYLQDPGKCNHLKSRQAKEKLFVVYYPVSFWMRPWKFFFGGGSSSIHTNSETRDKHTLLFKDGRQVWVY